MKNRIRIIVYGALITLFIVVILLVRHNIRKDICPKNVQEEFFLYVDNFVCKGYQYKISSAGLKRIDEKNFSYRDENINIYFVISPVNEKIEYFKIIYNNLRDKVTCEKDYLSFVLENNFLKDKMGNEYTKFTKEYSDESIIIKSTREINGKKVYNNQCHNAYILPFPDEFEIIFNEKDRSIFRIIIPDSIPQDNYPKEDLLSNEEILRKVKRTIEYKVYTKFNAGEYVYIKDEEEDKYFYFFIPDWSSIFFKRKSSKKIRSTPPRLARIIFVNNYKNSSSTIFILDANSGEILLYAPDGCSPPNKEGLR